MCRSIRTAALLLPLALGCAMVPSGNEAIKAVGRDPVRWKDNGDGTVLDTNTGLMWEKKTGVLPTEGRFLHLYAFSRATLSRGGECDQSERWSGSSSSIRLYGHDGNFSSVSLSQA